MGAPLFLCPRPASSESRRQASDRSRCGPFAQRGHCAWRKFDDYQAGTDCKAWLFGILFRTVAHHRRKESRPDRHGIYREPVFLAAKRPVSERVTDEELLRMLARLNPNQRSLVELIDVQGYSYRDAADQTGIPIGTVMSRLCRGRQRLREMLTAQVFRLESSPWPAGICLPMAE